MRKKHLVITVVCLTALAFAGAFGFLTTRLSADPRLAMAELRIDNMTCGSCVATITGALENMDGIESVDVSVTSGRGTVVFNPEEIGAEAIAQTVTGAGYPAAVDQLLDQDQYLALRSEEERLAVDYVARVGDRLIPRSLYDLEVEKQLQAGGFEDLPESRVRVAGRSWQSLLERTLLLQAAENNQVVVQDGEVQLRIEKLRQGIPDMDDYIRSRHGSMEAFFKTVKEDMIIRRNIDDHVLVRVTDPRQRQQQLNLWFRDLLDGTPVVIYDEQLKQTAGPAGGCGSGCCS